MISWDSLVELLDVTLDSKRKRHIVGGMLLSISFLFGGFAVTVMTLSEEDRKKKLPVDKEEEEIEG